MPKTTTLAPLGFLNGFVAVRDLAGPDNRPLFRYRCTSEELAQLRQSLHQAIGDRLTEVPQRATAGAMVLFFAEWWRRNHQSGAWKWSSLFESLGLGEVPKHGKVLYPTIERGLQYWHHQHCSGSAISPAPAAANAVPPRFSTAMRRTRRRNMGIASKATK